MKRFKKIVIVYFCWLFTVICSGEDTSASIMSFVKEQESKFQLGTDRDIVLLLGISGDGVSSTASFLVDDDLVAEESSEDPDLLSIFDINNRIGHIANKSKTSLPELMIDPVSGTAYYDCPGFLDTRGSEYEISTANLLNKLFNFANSFKVVFVMNQWTLESTEYLFHFTELIKHAISLDFEGFSDNTAVILTNAMEDYHIEEDISIALSDDEITKKVAKYLSDCAEGAESVLEEPDATDHERHFYSKAIKFIKPLLTKQNDKFQRIGVFRSPVVTGRLNDMEVLQEEKIRLNEMINENLEFVQNRDFKFGFPITEKTFQKIYQIIRKELLDDVNIIFDAIEQFYLQKEKRNTDIKSLHDHFALGYERFDNINTSDARWFLKEIIAVATAAGIALPNKVLYLDPEHEENINFLTKVIGSSQLNIPELDLSVRTMLHRIDCSRRWYEFLIDFQTILSREDLNKYGMRDAAIELRENCLTNESEMKYVGDIDLNRFMSYTSVPHLYLRVGRLQVNTFELKALHSILSALWQ